MDDNEVLKLRALAKARALRMRGEQPTDSSGIDPNAKGQYVQGSYLPKPRTVFPFASPAVGEPFRAVGRSFQQASEDIKNGFPLAGMIGGGRAGIQAAMSPLAAGVEAVRQIPVVGEPAAWLATTPFDLAQKGLAYSASGYLGGAQKLGLPISDKTVEEGSGLVGDVGTIMIAPGIMKKGGELVRPIAGKLETRSNVANVGKAFDEWTQALRPNSKQLKNIGENQVDAARYVAESTREHPFEKESSNTSHYDHGTDVILPDAMNKIWSKVSEQVDRHSSNQIEGHEVVRNVLNQIPENVRELHPEQMGKIADFLKPYDRPISLRVLNQEISDLNAQTSGFWNAKGSRRAEMLRQDLLIGAKIQTANAMRSTLFDALDNLGEKGTGQLRKDYGAVSSLYDIQDAKRGSAWQRDASSIWQTPIRRGFVGGAMAKIGGASPLAALGIEAGITGYEAWGKFKSKPSQLIKSAYEKLAGVKTLTPTYPSASPYLLPETAQSAIDASRVKIALPNPSISPLQRPPITTNTFEVPESFIRGTGKEGMDINKWQDATSAFPTNRMWVSQSPFMEPPSFNMGKPGSPGDWARQVENFSKSLPPDHPAQPVLKTAQRKVKAGVALNNGEVNVLRQIMGGGK